MAVPQSIRRKMNRLTAGSPPRFMDLFSGCGGISLGFVTAGYELVASVELDPWAAESHGANFASASRGTNHQAHFKARDITKENPVLKQALIGGYETESGCRVDARRLLLGETENALYYALIAEYQRGHQQEAAREKEKLAELLDKFEKYAESPPSYRPGKPGMPQAD